MGIFLRILTATSLIEAVAITGCYSEMVRLRPPPERNPGVVLPVRVKVSLNKCISKPGSECWQGGTATLREWNYDMLYLSEGGEEFQIPIRSVNEIVFYDDKSLALIVSAVSGLLVGYGLLWALIFIR